LDKSANQTPLKLYLPQSWKRTLTIRFTNQRKVKHRRLSGPEAKPPRNYDFLSPWCDVLVGHLMATDNLISFGDYEKPSKKQQPKESLEDASRRKREALALLLLVGRVDQLAWQDLLEKK
jgi:hypothetical protein